MKTSLLFKLGIYKVYPVTLDNNIETIVRKHKNPLSEKDLELYKLITEERVIDRERIIFLYALFKNNDDTGIRIRSNLISNSTGVLGINLYSNRYFEVTYIDGLSFLNSEALAKAALTRPNNWHNKD